MKKLLKTLLAKLSMRSIVRDADQIGQLDFNTGKVTW